MKLMDIVQDTMGTVLESVNDPEASVKDVSDRVKRISSAYFTLLDKIQYGLKGTLHQMVEEGLLMIDPVTKDPIVLPPPVRQQRQQLDDLIRNNVLPSLE